MGTTRISESVSIARPPAEVWNAIADYSFDQEWRSSLTEMTPEPPGGPEPGTKVREVVRNMGRDYGLKKDLGRLKELLETER
jgi:hypothetical protein